VIAGTGTGGEILGRDIETVVGEAVLGTDLDGVDQEIEIGEVDLGIGTAGVVGIVADHEIETRVGGLMILTVAGWLSWQLSPKLQLFMMGKLRVSCSSDVLCSWKV
jgi:hypothetical protein